MRHPTPEPHSRPGRPRAMALPAAAGLSLALLACTEDPRYVHPPMAIEVGAEGSDVTEATEQVSLPVRLEEEDEAMERAALETELGVMVPYVDLETLQLSLEWTIRNLSDQDGMARIHVNGANEYFAYVPSAFVVDPEEEEEPPPLLGDVPLPIPAQGTLTGVYREDELLEAAIDLELITRGAINPFTAVLSVSEDTAEIPDATGAVIPREAFAQLIRLDLTLIADRHMVLEYALRIRDERRPNRIHDEGLEAAADELTVFEPADFQPPPPPPEM